MASVYWAARDLDGVPWGNHSFILVILAEGESIRGIPTQVEFVNGRWIRFITMGGFNVDGRLKFEHNQSADVTAVREFLDPAQHVSAFKSDFDLERHSVSVAGKTNFELAQEIARYAANYSRNEGVNNVEYSLVDENCSAWANSILKKAGVTRTDRLAAGEFFGIDWGEEDEVPATLFD